MTVDLAVWYAAQLDAAEVAAKAVVAGPWHVDGDVVYDAAGDWVAEGHYAPGSAPQRAIAEHIAAHDPSWRLADIAMKRAIFVEHSATNNGYCGRCSQDSEQVAPIGFWVPHPCRTVRLLAAEFAAAPGYRDEWRPEWART